MPLELAASETHRNVSLGDDLHKSRETAEKKQDAIPCSKTEIKV